MSIEKRQTLSLNSDFRELGDAGDVLDFFSEGLLGVVPVDKCTLFDASPPSIQARMKINDSYNFLCFFFSKLQVLF